MNLKYLKSTMVFALALLVTTAVQAGNIETGKNLVWGENIGWINLSPEGKDGVTVSDDAVSGFLWSENTGWINLNPENGNDLRGIKNDGNGNLSGYGWSENTGWVKFDGVKIDPCSGVFSGKAWGENTGWINFDVLDFSKEVVTAWRKDSDDDGTPDCNDNCSDDPDKTEPGVCGCGETDTDTDDDGTPDCNDLCPDAPDKTEPGVCGCGEPDKDSDGDGVLDCNENEPPPGSSSGSSGVCFIQSLTGK